MKFCIYRRMIETNQSMNYLASYLASNNSLTKNLWDSVKNAIFAMCILHSRHPHDTLCDFRLVLQLKRNQRFSWFYHC